MVKYAMLTRHKTFMTSCIMALALLGGCDDHVISNQIDGWSSAGGYDAASHDGSFDPRDARSIPETTGGDGVSEGSAQAAEDGEPTDSEIRDALIQESIDGYPGPCPCPYSRTRRGSRCGRLSAYDREGGYEPLCYTEDVTDEMVVDYRGSLN